MSLTTSLAGRPTTVRRAVLSTVAARRNYGNPES